jgi:hypothetical protein
MLGLMTVVSFDPAAMSVRDLRYAQVAIIRVCEQG